MIVLRKTKTITNQNQAEVLQIRRMKNRNRFSEKYWEKNRTQSFFGFFVLGVPFFHSCVFSTSWLLFSSTEFVSTLDCLFVNFRIFSAAFWRAEKTGNIQHNSPIYKECQTQSALVLALPWKQANQDDSNDTPQPVNEFQVSYPLLWIRINQDNP